MSKKHKKWEAPENDTFMDAVNAMVEAENNGEEYKIPIYSCADLETMNKLGCSNISCLRTEELRCENCIFSEGRSVNKDQLKFERGGLGLTFNKEVEDYLYRTLGFKSNSIYYMITSNELDIIEL